jgi:hypothetical protein
MAQSMDKDHFPPGFSFADLKSIISEMEESNTEINVSMRQFLFTQLIEVLYKDW